MLGLVGQVLVIVQLRLTRTSHTKEVLSHSLRGTHLGVLLGGVGLNRMLHRLTELFLQLVLPALIDVLTSGFDLLLREGGNFGVLHRGE